MRNYKLYLILFLAAFLRINYDTFIEGYNYDEIAIMSSAIQSFPFGIIKTAATNDYHAPLFQLIAHFFTYLNPEWVYIRLFNTFLSIVNVYVFYKIGSLVKNKNAGYLCALVLTVNHLAISTASFIKFYALAFLLVSINLYYFIKILKTNSGFNRLGICNILLILTSTYGFILVILEYFYLLIFKRSEKLYKSAVISIIGFAIYLPMLLVQIKLNYSNLFSAHSYYVEFTPLSFYNALNDYFSPLLNYCCNIQTISAGTILLKFIKLKEPHFLIEFIILSLFPVIFALTCIFKSLKNEFAKKIMIIATAFLFSFILMVKLELTGMVPIYIYPFMLLCLAMIGIGILEFKNKKLICTIFIIYLLVNLSITNCYPPDKRGFFRPKLYQAIEQYYIDNGDVKLIATSGGRFVAKYYKDKVIFDFDNEKIKGIFQKKFLALVYGKNIAEKINKKNAYNLLKPLLLNKYKDPEFEKYFIDNVYNKINRGDNVVFCFTGEEYTFLEKYEDYSQWLINLPYNPHLSKADMKNALSDGENFVDSAILGQAIEANSYEYLIELLDKYFSRVKFEQYTKTNKDKWIKTLEDNTNTYSTLFLAQNATKSWIFVTYKKK